MPGLQGGKAASITLSVGDEWCEQGAVGAFGSRVRLLEDGRFFSPTQALQTKAPCSVLSRLLPRELIGEERKLTRGLERRMYASKAPVLESTYGVAVTLPLLSTTVYGRNGWTLR